MTEAADFSGCALAMTTCGDEETAQKLARAMVAQGLAACAQISPIRSFYIWDGALQDAAEIRIDFKLRARDYAVFERELRKIHPYDTPEIILIPIQDGFKPYLEWVERAAKNAAL